MIRRLIACGRCTALLRVDMANAGTHVTCPHCGFKELTTAAIIRTDNE